MAYSSNIKSLIDNTLCGIEIENLRTTNKGCLSEQPHPKGFGSPLFNPHFTKDFAEAQVETITSPFASPKKALQELENLMAYAHQQLNQELFWPIAMPCRLPTYNDSFIADFGATNEGERKWLYRKGLQQRYGHQVQLICGLHYNFSIQDEWLKKEYHQLNPAISYRDFVSSRYLNLMRNFIERSYLLVYLFGASPNIDESYKPIKKNHPYATSLRMSPFGYHSPYQCHLDISYQDIEHFIHSFERELNTPCRAFSHIEQQINTNVLQTENELYVPIRAKNHIESRLGALKAIKNKGITYVEVRTLDLNPFEPAGVALDDLEFLHLFLIDCFLREKKTLSKQAIKNARRNQHHIALEGRKPGVKLSNQKAFKTQALAILEQVKETALLFGLEHLVQKQIEKINNPHLTTSAQVLAKTNTSKSFLNFGLKYARQHHRYFQNYPQDEQRNNQLQKEAHDSLIEQDIADAKARYTLPGYEGLEKSTQAVIREALKQNIHVEVLDAVENFIRLTKGSHQEVIKEATKTRLDHYISPLIMENKIISKQLLNEANLFTPKGASFTSFEEALRAYPSFEKIKIVVKPNTTNFGIAVYFIEPHSRGEYEMALQSAFQHGSRVIVEEYFSGEEYRFLVIGEEVVGIIKRVPANVVGNGIDTIKNLVEKKNKDPRSYKDAKTAIYLSEIELYYLSLQQLSPKSVPKEGEQIFLRHNSNVSTGGDSIDMTDEMHPQFRTIALQAARAGQAQICGVDIMIVNNQKPPSPTNYRIIEINHNPALLVHEFPIRGQPRNTAKPLLKLLGF
ncbi:MAG: hypothetical protein K9M07_00670 [Simkaniaceae bacterium]|nr:hypothetical protein [Simkaniaceae bacterium]MCF7851735.1 hypothetical protein [Simkaniaceae bacterium]